MRQSDPDFTSPPRGEVGIDRRAFTALILGAAFTSPRAAGAQTPAKPVIGFIHSADAAGNQYEVSALRRGLSDSGYVDGQNAIVEQHWAEGHYDRLPAIAADYVRRGIAVIVAGGGNAPAQAAKDQTGTIPIVFVTGDDPIRAGLVASLNRPGGNATGISFFDSVLVGKRLELIRELLPSATTIAFMVNPASHAAAQETAAAQTAAEGLGLELHVLPTTTPQDIERNFAALAGLHVQAVLMAGDPYLGSLRDQIAAGADRFAIPVIGSTQVYVRAGCLISYSTSVDDAYREAGIYVARILKGEKPSELPVMQPTRFTLSVNMKAAKRLNITVPQSILFRADEVIE